MSPVDAAALVIALALGMGQSEALEAEADAQIDTVPDDGNVRIQNNTSGAISCTQVGAGAFTIAARRPVTLRGSPVRVQCPGTSAQQGMTLRSGERYVFLPGPNGPQLGQVE